MAHSTPGQLIPSKKVHLLTSTLTFRLISDQDQEAAEAGVG